MAYNTSALVTTRVSTNDASYLTGLTDGEGSFLVSFQKRPTMRLGIEVRPSFTLSQHQRNKAILDWIVEFFGCGTVRFNRSDETYKYEVRSLTDLLEVVIPHFDQHPLRTSKAADFQKCKSICLLMAQGKHLTKAGMSEIITRAYAMNNWGARRYDKQ